jgi:hypothetical protein
VQQSTRGIRQVAFGAGDAWLILFDSGNAVWSDIPRRLHKQLTQKSACHATLAAVAMGPAGEWFVAYSDETWKVK